MYLCPLMYLRPHVLVQSCTCAIMYLLIFHTRLTQQLELHVCIASDFCTCARSTNSQLATFHIPQMHEMSELIRSPGTYIKMFAAVQTRLPYSSQAAHGCFSLETPNQGWVYVTRELETVKGEMSFRCQVKHFVDPFCFVMLKQLAMHLCH